MDYFGAEERLKEPLTESWRQIVRFRVVNLHDGGLHVQFTPRTGQFLTQSARTRLDPRLLKKARTPAMEQDTLQQVNVYCHAVSIKSSSQIISHTFITKISNGFAIETSNTFITGISNVFIIKINHGSVINPKKYIIIQRV